MENMEDEKYEMLVWSLQGEALDSPGWFRARVLLISLSAYLILFGLLVVLLIGLLFMWAVAHAHLMFKVLFVSWVLVIVPIVWLSFRMFFRSLPAPEGRELHEDDAPALFEMISELRARVQGAPIHHVLITNEFNAAIAQRPRFGFFGGYRNYLILGLPLLYAVTPEEILAVVAHEYGHLSGGHGKLSGWIYRQRATFSALYDHAKTRRESNFVNGILAGLLDWFAPYYHAYTFVLSRQDEYEADAMARDIAGAEAGASALIRIDLLSNWLDRRFWSKIYEQAARNPAPTFMPYVAMPKLLAVTMDEWATKERLQEAWKEESDIYDTHPCLRERVSALEQRARLPDVTKTCAADALLGPFALMLAKEFDQEWWAAEKQKWQSYHNRYARSTARIAELEQQPLPELSALDAQELALLLVEFRSLGAAKLVLQHLVGRPGERYPKPAYYYGRALLDEGDMRGLDYLEEAYRLSPALGNDCAKAGYEWLYKRRDAAAAERWLERLSEAGAPA